MRDAAARVEVRLADLPGLLYRITTPFDAGLAPQVNGPAGRPRLRLRATGGIGLDTVTVLLNRTVRWDIRLPAGAGEQLLDLRDGKLAQVQVGAAAMVDLILPAPDRTVPITLSGPVGTFTLDAPTRTPLWVRLREGASQAVVPWEREHEAEPGEILASRGWMRARDRYAIDARGAVGSLVADRTPLAGH